MAGAVNLGSVYAELALKTEEFDKGVDKASDSINRLAKTTMGSASLMGDSLERVAKVGFIGLGIAVASATGVIIANLNRAVKRVDTLDNSTRTLENIGIKTDDAKAAVKRLTDSILGLPTPLDEAIRGMTDLTATYGDVNKGQEVFSALNDAVIGFGGSSQEVSNAIAQLSQLPMDGPLDGQTWLSLRNSGLTPVIRAIANDMGKSIGQLQQDFSTGKLKVSDFINELVKLDKNGGGGMKSLQQIAHDATKGIGTSFENMRTAITRGLAAVLKAIGTADIAKVINDIGKAFESALKKLVGFIGYIKDNASVFGTITVSVIAMVAAIMTISVATKAMVLFTTAIEGVQIAMALFTALTQSGTGAMIAFEAATAINPFALVIIAIATVTAGLIYFFKKTEAGRQLWKKFTDGFDNFWQVIKPIRDFIGDQLASAFDSLRQIWAKLTEAMKPLVDMFEVFWKEHGKQVVEVLKVLGIVLGAITLVPLVTAFGVLLATMKVLAVVLKLVADHFDGIKTVVIDVTKVAFAPIIVAVKTITTVVDKLDIKWSDVWKHIKDTTVTAKDTVIDSYNKIKDVIAELRVSLDKLLDKWDTVWARIKDTSLSAKDTISGAFSSIKTSVSNTRDNIGNDIDSMQTKFNTFSTNLSTFASTMSHAFDGGTGSEKAAADLDVINQKLAGMINGVLGNWSTSIQTFISTLPEQFSSIGTVFTTIWNNAYAAVSTFLTNAGDSISLWVKNLPEVSFKDMWDSITRAWDNAYLATKQFFMGLADRLAPDVQKSGTDTGTKLVDSTKNEISSIESIRKVGDAILTLIALAIVFFFVYGWDLMFRAGRKIIDGLIAGITAMAPAARIAAGEIADRITGLFIAPGRWLFNAGKMIVQGLIDGLTSMLGTVKRVAEDIANTVTNAVKNALRIKSPSRVMAGIGVNTVKGFTMGLDKMKGSLEKNVADTFSIDQSTIKGISGSIGNSFNIEPNKVASSAGNANLGNSVAIYGNISIQNQQDADYLLQRLSHRQDLTMQGLVGA